DYEIGCQLVDGTTDLLGCDEKGLPRGNRGGGICHRAVAAVIDRILPLDAISAHIGPVLLRANPTPTKLSTNFGMAPSAHRTPLRLSSPRTSEWLVRSTNTLAKPRVSRSVMIA